MRHMHPQSGLTLVELMVTMVILAILASVAFPGFRSMLVRNSMATSVNLVLNSINYARSEAVRQGGVTTLVARNPSNTSNDWGEGWQVLVGAANTAASPCAPPTCLQQLDGVADGLTFDSPSDLSFVQFNSRGGVVGNTWVRLNVCIPGDYGVQLNITPIGRVATSDLAAVQCP